MQVPTPRPGLVLTYSYLWWDEAMRGRDEGVKDRPCVIVLSVATSAGDTVVTVAPITHTRPSDPGSAIELPAETKRRLGLDNHPSWIVCSDLNRFAWPGFDLRPFRRGSEQCELGVLPTSLLAKVRDRVLACVRTGTVRTTSR